jgi:hypothetical protein
MPFRSAPFGILSWTPGFDINFGVGTVEVEIDDDIQFGFIVYCGNGRDLWLGTAYLLEDPVRSVALPSGLRRKILETLLAEHPEIRAAGRVGA